MFSIPRFFSFATPKECLVVLGPEHTGHFVQPHVAAHCGGHTRATCGGDMYVMYANAVCGGDEPQPVAHLSHKLQCARQSLKIMASYGNKYPRHNARPHVVEQSGQCARALMASETNLPAVTVSLLPILLRLFLWSGRRQVLPLRPNHLPAKVRIW